MQVRERKRADIERRLSALNLEFAEWQKLSEAGGPFRKYHYSIQRLTGQLGGAARALRDKLEKADPLAAGSGIEAASLELHRIWEFFRSKLAQRTIGWYRDYLLAADELAWCCYRPARDLAVASNAAVGEKDVTEPPLVYFNGAASPLAVSRDVQYLDFIEKPLIQRQIEVAEHRELLKRLPVPVIGIPWFHVQHLPDALLVCHEVGHIIEDDLKMGPRIEALLGEALKSIAPDRHAAWTAWRGEVFADVAGALAAGPAFVEALVHFLAKSPEEIAAEKWPSFITRTYPTTALRVRLNLEVLRQLGFKSHVDDLGQRWGVVYGETHALSTFDGDLEPVVRALLDGPCPELGADQTFRKTLGLDAFAWQLAEEDAARLLAEIDPVAGDARVLFAAASIAYAKNPAAYVASGHAVVLAKVRATQDNTVRGASDPAEGLKAYDEARGGELLDLFMPEASALPKP